jgi:hypothetical protein
LFLSAGVLANLGFRDGLDLYVVAVLALISTYLLWEAAGSRCSSITPPRTVGLIRKPYCAGIAPVIFRAIVAKSGYTLNIGGLQPDR